MTSTLAASYGLNASWSLDMASLQQYTVADALAAGDSSSLTCNPAWRAGTPPDCGGLANAALAPDAIQIRFPAGSYGSPQRTDLGHGGGGAQFYERLADPQPSMLLEYEVYFPADFPWRMGGKLPGLYASSVGAASGCSGGSPSDGSCWSLRVMWRDGGAGEVYAYLPPENRGLCSRPNRCDGQFGISFGRGSFHFVPGQWNSVSLYVQLNAPASYDNGHVDLAVNGQRAVSVGRLRYTQADHAGGAPLLPSHLVFSTFFGGDTPDYAAPVDTTLLFRGFRLSVGSNFSSTTSGNTHAPRISGPGPWALVRVFGLLVLLLLGAPWLAAG